MVKLIGIGLGALILLFFLYASFKIRLGIYVKTVSRFKTLENKIALTFDDGPDPEITPKILDILKKYHVRAVFFCIGEKIEKNRDLARRILDEGHLIGNHTNRHSSFFPFYTSSQMKKEIDACWRKIIAVGIPDSVRLFRPPFGITNPTLRRALKNSGYTVIGWNIRALDTIIQFRDYVTRRINKKIKRGSIILLHDTQPNTPYIVNRVIRFALNKGYLFVRIDEYV